MIEHQQLRQQVDQACQEYEAEHGPTCILDYREGVITGVALGMTMAVKAFDPSLAIDLGRVFAEMKEKREEKE